MASFMRHTRVFLRVPLPEGVGLRLCCAAASVQVPLPRLTGPRTT